MILRTTFFILFLGLFNLLKAQQNSTALYVDVSENFINQTLLENNSSQSFNLKHNDIELVLTGNVQIEIVPSKVIGRLVIGGVIDVLGIQRSLYEVIDIPIKIDEEGYSISYNQVDAIFQQVETFINDYGFDDKFDQYLQEIIELANKSNQKGYLDDDVLIQINESASDINDMVSEVETWIINEYENKVIPIYPKNLVNELNGSIPPTIDLTIDNISLGVMLFDDKIRFSVIVDSNVSKSELNMRYSKEDVKIGWFTDPLRKQLFLHYQSNVEGYVITGYHLVTGYFNITLVGPAQYVNHVDDIYLPVDIDQEGKFQIKKDDLGLLNPKYLPKGNYTLIYSYTKNGIPQFGDMSINL